MSLAIFAESITTLLDMWLDEFIEYIKRLNLALSAAPRSGSRQRIVWSARFGLAQVLPLVFRS